MRIDPKKRINYDWNSLLYNDDVKTAYAVEVRNRFEALQTAIDNETSDTKSNNIIDAHKEAAVIHIPKKPKRKSHTLWENEKAQTKQR